MKILKAALILSLIGLVAGEACVSKYQCIDVGCIHHTTLTCQNNLCTCTPITDVYRCLSPGDCRRHTGVCYTEWECIQEQCRCK
ncbi:serine protease inhibitor Cvsi-2-like [Saccostrea echinata]|uniref:serine protease inhibitor Cvsi-2-like n=1 Tax=Saccostrea echinata TaxID=191078 RepID=UPI002A81E6EE|nr:serine protease inhibitor Cvsi-2-like [Saccostrea echinata]